MDSLQSKGGGDGQPPTPAFGPHPSKEACGHLRLHRFVNGRYLSLFRSAFPLSAYGLSERPVESHNLRVSQQLRPRAAHRRVLLTAHAVNLLAGQVLPPQPPVILIDSQRIQRRLADEGANDGCDIRPLLRSFRLGLILGLILGLSLGLSLALKRTLTLRRRLVLRGGLAGA